MNCPPAESCGMALGIMPANIYPHFDEFYLIARLYWQDKNLPERIDKFFRTTIASNNPYELTSEELKHCRESAVYMAEVIRDIVQENENRDFSHIRSRDREEIIKRSKEAIKATVSSMLNWKMLYGNPPIPQPSQGPS